jgi:hypothetical protein
VGTALADLSATSAGAPAWTWAIPLIVGLIALAGVAATAFISLRNTAKQIKSAHALKIAEMRQAWINNLRDSMASFMSIRETPDTDPFKNREYWEKAAKIDLLMNPNDPDYKALQISFNEAQDNNDGTARKATFMNICQRILKREWEALKREVAQAAGEKDPKKNSN